MGNERFFRGCGHKFDAAQDSRAHIIPSALGGRLKRRGLLCRECNGHLGESADKSLIKSLGFFTTFLGIEHRARSRGKSRSALDRTRWFRVLGWRGWETILS